MSLALPLPDAASPTPSRPARTSSPAQTSAQTSARILDRPSDCVDSTEILRGQKTVEINHNGSTYRLQATRLGKLILTK